MKVEAFFNTQSLITGIDRKIEKVPVVAVDNYIILGQLTALRFLEWVCENPGGVVALPTGKTPEFFIKWTMHYLEHWEREMKSGILAEIGLDPAMKPDIQSLHFVQLDEFFPINPKHERSFSYFIKQFYIDGFGLDPAKALLIDTWSIDSARKKVFRDIDNIADVFPEGVIDLSLRTKQPSNKKEELQKKTIKYFDQFCEDYETAIHRLGGIGFFLGGIGPDGHIAFNVRGSSHHSHTRLTQINYETQAAAASDLGGIESVRKKAVITIGLGTITANPNAVAIIIAAGQAKSGVVADAIQNNPALEYPASCLQKLPNARFYITEAASGKLHERTVRKLRAAGAVDESVIEDLVIRGCESVGVKLMEITNQPEKIKNTKCEEWDLAKSLTGKTLAELTEMTWEALTEKIDSGLDMPANERFLHTGPHHDDIELAYFPVLHHLVRSEHNENDFVYCTSGFTAVTNDYVLSCLNNVKSAVKSGQLYKTISRENLSDINQGQDDIIGALNSIAAQSSEDLDVYIAARLVRYLFADLKTESDQELLQFVTEQINALKKLSPGQMDTPMVQTIKGWIREFEAELVWGHFGIGMDRVHHLRLKFYTGDIFPRYPEYETDIKPILELMEKTQPTVVTLALDPEGSGPDTHYKTLIALAGAIDKYVEKYPEVNLQIWGYRNVWTRFEASEVSMIVPVSLNSFAVLHNMFNNCFLSQKSASFPSYELDGTFSQLAQKIWVDQFNDLVGLLGKRYFYHSPNPLMRRAYGAIYIKKMSYPEFVEHMKPVRRLLGQKAELSD